MGSTAAPSFYPLSTTNTYPSFSLDVASLSRAIWRTSDAGNSGGREVRASTGKGVGLRKHGGAESEQNGGVRRPERWLNWPVIATVCANGDNRTRRLELYQMTWTRPEYVNNNFVMEWENHEIKISVGDTTSKVCRDLDRCTEQLRL